MRSIEDRASRTGEEEPRDLAEDAKQAEERAAPAPRGAVRAARDRDDPVVLRCEMRWNASRLESSNVHERRICEARAEERTWAKIESGVTVKSAERNPPTPSL